MGTRANADEIVLLRSELQAMTVTDLSEHPNRLREISLRHPNSITMLDSPYPPEGYTCLVHALDLVGEYEYIRIAGLQVEDVFAGCKYVEWLLRKDLLVAIPEESLTKDDIVLYFDDSGFKHAALFLERDRVQSKWGTFDLYEHALWEVPSSYGNDIRFFKSLPYHESIRHFKRYAEEMGVVFV